MKLSNKNMSFSKANKLLFLRPFFLVILSTGVLITSVTTAHASSVRVPAEIQYQRVNSFFSTRAEACDFFGAHINRNPRSYNVTVNGGAPHSTIEGQCTYMATKIGSDDPPFETSYSGTLSSYSCPEGYQVIYSGGTFYCTVPDQKCPNGYKFSRAGSCEASCPVGSVWNDVASECSTPEEELSCKDQGPHPIDFMSGRKYRTEQIISTGINYPFTFVYHYNNQANQEYSRIGTPVGVLIDTSFVADTKPLINDADFDNSYTSRGLAKTNNNYRSDQYYGGISQYWRHNFDEVLVIVGNVYRYHTAKGQRIHLSSNGLSDSYPQLKLSKKVGSSDELLYELVDRKTNEKRVFNQNGRLESLWYDQVNYLLFDYDDNQNLIKITNREGSFLIIDYEQKTGASINSVESYPIYYPSVITADTGNTSQLKWDQYYRGRTQFYYLLSKLTGALSTEPGVSYEYEYKNGLFPASITSVLLTGTHLGRRQLNTFKYDLLGRAVSSELADGVESYQVEYVDDMSRLITNSLGKKTKYTYAMFNGVKRLQSVNGESTLNCAESDTSYQYNDNGTLLEKNKNEIVTRYEYNAQNLETSRTEAQGTPQARTIQTEWHSDFSKPIKITEPERTTEYTYDTQGRLLNSKVTPTP